MKPCGWRKIWQKQAWRRQAPEKPRGHTWGGRWSAGAAAAGVGRLPCPTAAVQGCNHQTLYIIKKNWAKKNVGKNLTCCGKSERGRPEAVGGGAHPRWPGSGAPASPSCAPPTPGFSCQSKNAFHSLLILRVRSKFYYTQNQVS